MISVKNISKEYVTKTQRIKALHDVSLEIGEGESLAILGLNGSGKSTLVNTITGISSPTGGNVTIGNLSPKDGKIYRQQFSAVYQNNGVDFYLSLYDNLKTHGYMYGLRGKELCKAIGDVMEIMELSKYKKNRISELSGGYAKRVQVAKTLMLDTPIIILDEPTHGMDPVIKKRLFEILNHRRREGKIIIYTTQILEEVEKICNSVAILQNGYLISKDTIGNIKQKFSKNMCLQICLSDTERNKIFSEELLRGLIDRYRISLKACELLPPDIKIITESKADLLLQFSYELGAFIDIDELNIKKASLEEILINGREGL